MVRRRPMRLRSREEQNAAFASMHDDGTYRRSHRRRRVKKYSGIEPRMITTREKEAIHRSHLEQEKETIQEKERIRNLDEKILREKKDLHKSPDSTQNTPTSYAVGTTYKRDKGIYYPITNRKYTKYNSALKAKEKLQEENKGVTYKIITVNNVGQPTARFYKKESD